MEFKEELKKSWNDIKEWINKDRIKKFKEYKFDKIIFQTSMLLIFGFLFFVAFSYNFDLDYYKCGAAPTEKCENPFYEKANWKNVQYLPPGEYGTKPGPLFNSMKAVTFFLLALAFAVNHFVYNRNYKFKWGDML